MMTLHQVFAEFAPHMGCRFVLAGGCVRDIMHGYKPRDWDLFCFGYPQWRQMAARYGAAPRETKQYRDALCMTFRWMGEEIQIIHRKGLRTIPALLDEFDWRICQYAFDGVQVRTVDSTDEITPGGLLRINNPCSPDKSLERGERFAERFGMAIEPLSRACLESKMQSSGRLQMLSRLRLHHQKMAA